MTRDDMIEEYIAQYKETLHDYNPVMRMELECMDDDELMEEFLAYCR